MMSWISKCLIGFYLASSPLLISAEERKLSVPQGSVGVAFLENQDDERYWLALTFPEEMLGSSDHRLPETAIVVTGRISLFDEKGELWSGDIKHAELKPEFWCENDGGSHYRPVLRITLKKSTLPRPLVRNTKQDDVAAFVGVGPKKSFLALKAQTAAGESTQNYPDFWEKEVGRGTANGAIIAQLIESYTEAGCGNELLQDALSLRTARGKAAIRCCGP